ncbi:hypothetical protein M426DRAFT_182562 [Hypoxylon sp. CI-4A]|nr:hypothetical protein M426DRAFT_182562 [Hypoxylon sp. CI-4A]
MSNSVRCVQCSKLTLEGLVDDGYLVDGDALNFVSEPTQEQAACGICTLIRHAIRYDSGKLHCNSEPGGKMALYLYRNPPAWSSERMHQIDAIAMPPRLKEGTWSGNGGSWIFGPPDEKPYVARGIIDVRCSSGASQGSPLDLELRYRLPIENFESPESVKFVSDALSKCVNTHRRSICIPNVFTKLPSRVIHVGYGTSTRIKLIESRDLIGKYTALSYCWGENPSLNFQMTSANRSSLMESIPLEELPRTIQDAALFTKLLGIKYLWVDSLCIIQGSDEIAQKDWLKESQQMRTVFGNAFITISASGSTDAHQGLFKNRIMPNELYRTIPVSPSNPTPIFLGGHGHSTSPLDEPLSQRGWAFQENILSTRIVAFGLSELSFRCRKCTFFFTEMEHSPKLNSSSNLPKLLYINWTEIIEKYSMTLLTIPSDRLVAIQGIIDFIRIKYADTCIAGLWEKSLIPQLLWKSTSSNKKLSNCKPDVARDFPSWSWAGVHAPVKFLSKPHSRYKTRSDIDLEQNHIAQVLRGSPSRLIIWGGLKRFEAIRCAVQAEYNGVYDLYPPYRVFTFRMVA